MLSCCCFVLLFVFLGQLITTDYNLVSFLACRFQCRIFSQSIRRNLQYHSVLKYWMKPRYNSSRLWYLWLVVMWCTSIQTWVNAVRECEDFPRWPPRSQGTRGVPAEREVSRKVPRERGYPRWILMYPVYSIFKTGSAADVTVKPRVFGRNLRAWLLFPPPKTKPVLENNTSY